MKSREVTGVFPSGPDRVVARTAIDRIRKNQRTEFHLWQYDSHLRRCLIDRLKARWHGFTVIGRKDLRYGLCSPCGEQRRRDRVHDARCSYDNSPEQCNDSQQVMKIEPACSWRCGAAIGAELHTSHEGAVDQRSRDQGDYKRQRHHAHNQLSRKTQEQGFVQPQTEADEAQLRIRHTKNRAGMKVIGHRSYFSRPGFLGWTHVNKDTRRVIVPEHAVWMKRRILQLGLCNHPVYTCPRRTSWHRCRLCVRPQIIVQFIVEDQRKSGDACHKKECGADPARPFMDSIPGADGLCCQMCHSLDSKLKSDVQKLTVVERVTVRGVPMLSPLTPAEDQ